MEQRGDKLPFSAFVVCMKHSKRGVMMQGKLGDCGGTFLFSSSCVQSWALGRLSLTGKSQNLSIQHTRLGWLITHAWLMGARHFCLLFTWTRAHIHTRRVQYTSARTRTHWHGPRSKDTLKRSSKAGFLSAPSPFHFTLKRPVALKKHYEARSIIYIH